MTLPLGSLSGVVLFLMCLPMPGGSLPFGETEDLYIAEPNYDRIAVMDGEGLVLRTFTAPGLDGPRGVVFAPNDRIYVASSLTDEVVVFDRAEQYVARFSAPPLSAPSGMAINAADELLVVSEALNRVCVFALDGTFLRWFDAPGIKRPAYIALDAAGSVFVTDISGQVFEWDAAEQFVGAFGAPAGAIMSNPSGLAFNGSGELFVAGSASHNILRFSAAGVFVSEITHADLTFPHGLAFDDEDNLFVASMLEDSVVQFDASGVWAETFEDRGLHFPRDMAFAPPCLDSVGYCTAGTSYSGCQATLTTSGSASATKANGFLLQSAQVEGDKDGSFFYGANGRQAMTWGNGTSFMCIVPPVRRGGVMTRTGAAFTCDGWFQLDLNARWCPTCPRPMHNPGAGALVQAQLWYRDPLNTSNQTTSMSSSVEFLVCP